MRRTLLLDGTVMPDGLPRVEPVGAWLPAWSGGTRAHPGQAVGYASDLRSGRQRRLQRPLSQYGATPLPASDLAEYDHPLGEVGARGLLFERAATQLLEAADWDISTWTGTSSSAVTSGIEGPTGETTGEGQAYRFTSTSALGQRALSEVVAVNLNATTYVFSVWLKRQAGHVSETARIILRGGASSVTADFQVGTEWIRCWVTSPTVNSTTAQLIVIPAIDLDGIGTIEVWGPTLVDTGAAAANTERGRSTTISPSGVTVASKLSGAHAWPPAPWTFYARFRPFWGSADAIGHSVFGAYTTPSTNVIRLTKTSSDILQIAIRDVRAGTAVAFTTPALVEGDVWHVVGRCSRFGALEGYLNGVAFTDQVAAPGAIADRPPSQLDVGDDTTGLGPLDGALLRLEVWDDYLEPRRFY